MKTIAVILCAILGFLVAGPVGLVVLGGVALVIAVLLAAAGAMGSGLQTVVDALGKDGPSSGTEFDEAGLPKRAPRGPVQPGDEYLASKNREHNRVAAIVIAVVGGVILTGALFAYALPYIVLP